MSRRRENLSMKKDFQQLAAKIRAATEAGMAAVGVKVRA